MLCQKNFYGKVIEMPKIMPKDNVLDGRQKKVYPKRQINEQNRKKRKEERTKYNVAIMKEKRTYEGIEFDSELEMKYYRDVIIPQIKKGDIIFCELQKTYVLQPTFKPANYKSSIQSIKYVADFFLKYKDGREEVIDTKGYPDAVAKIKRKLFLYKYPDVSYHWICYSKMDGGWCEYEDVLNRRNKRHAEKKKKNEKKAEGNKNE